MGSRSPEIGARAGRSRQLKCTTANLRNTLRLDTETVWPDAETPLAGVGGMGKQKQLLARIADAEPQTDLADMLAAHRRRSLSGFAPTFVGSRPGMSAPAVTVRRHG
jgi:hypothetical protein